MNPRLVERRARSVDAAITEQLPDGRVTWKSTDGTQHAGVVAFHRLADNEALVTVQLGWQPDTVTDKAGAATGFDDAG